MSVERQRYADFKNSLERIEDLVIDFEDHLNHQESINHDRRVEEMLNTLRGDVKSSQDDLENISQSWHKVESTQAQVRSIREALASVVEGGLDTKIVAEFKNRKQELEKSLRWWKFWTIASVLTLFGSSWYIYSDISDSDPTSTVIFSKALLIFPVLVVVWFSFHQYNRHKILIEQYEFKTSMADSLMGFREILKQDFSDEDQKQVGQFVIDSVDRMYSEPGTNSSATNQQNRGQNQGMPQSNIDLLQKLVNK